MPGYNQLMGLVKLLTVVAISIYLKIIIDSVMR